MVDGVNIHQRIFGNFQVSQFRRNIDNIDHAPTDNGNFAVVLCCCADRLLQSVNICGKGRDNNAPFGITKCFVKGIPYQFFGFGISGAFSIGAVGHHQKDPLLPQSGDAMQIHHGAVYRRHINLEVAGMEDHTDGRMDRHPHRIGNTVIHPNKLDFKRTYGQCFTGAHFVEIRRNMGLF